MKVEGRGVKRRGFLMTSKGASVRFNDQDVKIWPRIAGKKAFD